LRLGIFAKTFRREGLNETLDAVLASGLQTIQFNLALSGGPPLPGEISAGLAARVVEETEHRGLAIAAVSGTYNMAHPDPGVRADGERRLEVLIAAAPAMGIPVVTLCTGSRDAADMWRRHPDNGSPEAWRDMREALERALPLAEARGVTLAIEPERNNVVDGAAAARRLLDELRSTQLKVVIDAANLFSNDDLNLQSEILREAFGLLGDDLVLAHAKDVRNDGTIVAAGRGNLDYELYLTLLRDAAPGIALILHGLAETEVAGSVSFLEAGLARTAAA
jgi:sugar phosphate isomerase/epimerase